MRVFIGIKAPDELQKQVLEWQEKHKALPVRFIARNNLHLTLVPPWYENKLNQLVKHLKSFELPVGDLGLLFEKILFAPPPSPRLIWLEGKTPLGLIKLRNDLVKHLGKNREKRPFQSHITIARFKPAEFQSFKYARIESEIDWQMDTREITLFESKLSPYGAEYTAIESIKI